MVSLVCGDQTQKSSRVMGTVSMCLGDSKMEEALIVFMRKHVWEPISDACYPSNSLPDAFGEMTLPVDKRGAVISLTLTRPFIWFAMISL